MEITRYNSFAIILHWVMAVAFIVMLTSGFVMSYAEIDKSFKFNMYQWHKSGGVILLIAFLVRIGWRFIGKVPSLPASFQGIEKLAAKAGHWGLYLMMLALPLTGWIMVSSSIYGLPTVVFNWFEWPHIPNIQANKDVNTAAKTAHFYLALLFAVLIAGHIAAVIKHILIDKENLLTRMWWAKRKEEN